MLQVPDRRAETLDCIQPFGFLLRELLPRWPVMSVLLGLALFEFELLPQRLQRPASETLHVVFGLLDASHQPLQVFHALPKLLLRVGTWDCPTVGVLHLPAAALIHGVLVHLLDRGELGFQRLKRAARVLLQLVQPRGPVGHRLRAHEELLAVRRLDKTLHLVFGLRGLDCGGLDARNLRVVGSALPGDSVAAEAVDLRDGQLFLCPLVFQ